GPRERTREPKGQSSCAWWASSTCVHPSVSALNHRGDTIERSAALTSLLTEGTHVLMVGHPRPSLSSPSWRSVHTTPYELRGCPISRTRILCMTFPMGETVFDIREVVTRVTVRHGRTCPVYLTDWH